MTPQKNEQPTQLTTESFNAIAGAFARLQMLGDKKLATGADDNSAAEKEQIVTFLATEMMTHLSEFLAAWVLANNEYLPMLRAVQAVAKRAGYFPTNTKAATVSPANN